MPSDWKNLKEAVEYANQYSRQPIDLNYIAIAKDIWEDIERIAKEQSNDGRVCSDGHMCFSPKCKTECIAKFQGDMRL